MSDFATDPSIYITGVEHDRAIACFVSYMDSFTGAWFQRLADSDPFAITADDLAAVTTLAVEVPARVAIWLRDEQDGDSGKESVSALLHAIPPDLDIVSVDRSQLDTDSPAQRLWRRLQRHSWPHGSVHHNGLGVVTAGKLLAAKRPALIPIWDQYVEQGLGPPHRQFWTTMWQRFRDQGFLLDLHRVREDAMRAAHDTQSRVRPGNVKVPMEPTLLRTLDIVVWMRVYGCVRSLVPEVRDLHHTDLGRP